MPRNTLSNCLCFKPVPVASMRPRRDAAEYHAGDERDQVRLRASMRPRRDAAEYILTARKPKSKCMLQ